MRAALSPRSECSQDLVQLLGEELGVVRVEGKGRPQPDGGVAATAAVHALLAQVGQDGVSPAVRILIHACSYEGCCSSFKIIRRDLCHLVQS